MHLHRYVIGILYHKRQFGMINSSGMLADSIFSELETNKKLEEGLFTKIAFPNNVNEQLFTLSDETDHNVLACKTDQFVFKKASPSSLVSLNQHKAHEEFNYIWNALAESYDMPPIRRIGIVAEYRIEEKEGGSASSDLFEAFIKTEKPKLVGKFHLSYESRKPTNAGIKINTATDDFWNTICSFYSSDRDETPAEGMLNANIDVQKYYNPAKKKLLPELRKVRDYFRAEKKIFREKLQALGFE